ncbi:metalloregulator ArsR/SmtB family transcription factor [Ktedonosporobacter rubrisoli]|uniref:Metalloregulator ArsR/SmtB family transcription factor n=1 Tax=Ktedonosporobacter rubrisoli TaxID=2509675 RepID=A0A4P6JV77_KTERU|nr:metalloregulator ArsR/SmtB family transcription factor [Ktedonosporobacter rubrisoli]QBD78856.1 metalloregulator ArsR/SmtB family transcription factor [Ktedonosporobacter rubrisoli]
MEPGEKRRFKTLLYEQFARMGKALASPHRLELLDVLSQGERTVEALAQETGMSVANASQHLQILRMARLVETRRAGVSIYYRLASEAVSLLWLSLRHVGEEHLAEVDQLVTIFLQDRASFHPMTVAELREAMQDERVILLDVRPQAEYQAGHLPQARSIPVAELKARLAELPKEREIVAYCRGPYCVFADEAVSFLRAQGYAARRLEEGVLEWQMLGLPIVR